MLRLRLVVIAATALAACVGLATPAVAKDKPPPVTCTEQGPCVVSVTAPGQPGSTGGPPQTQPVASGGSSAQCYYPRGSNNQVPCSDPKLGWLDTYNGCWYRALPAPSPGSQIAAEAGGYHAPGDGTYYMQSCMGIVGPPPGAVGLVQLVVWLQAPPAGYGGARPDPAILAQQAESKLGLAGPNIQLSPPEGSEQVVGLPTWMWTTVSNATWTRHSATAAVAGESVTATATAASIEWSMGDGSTVTCDGPGTPYSSTYGAHASSPTCGYTYTTPSSTAAHGTFPVTGTTTWRVTWAGGGQNGALTIRRSTTVRVVVDEAEAVNS
jgi:hypothetical protein